MHIHELKKRIFSDETAWMETVAMKKHITPDGITEWINNFFDELECTGENMKSVKDFKSHFFRWLKIQLKDRKEENNDRRLENW